MVEFLTGYKDAIASVQAIATIVAIILGGWWSWKAFIRTRVKYPCANVEHRIDSWRDGNRVFVHLSVHVQNSGNVLLGVSNGCAWLEQLTPLPLSVQERFEREDDAVQLGRTDMVWELVKKRELPKDYRIEIEPGESDQIHFDFAIDPVIQRVLIYSHIANEKRKDGGWNASTVYDIPQP